MRMALVMSFSVVAAGFRRPGGIDRGAEVTAGCRGRFQRQQRALGCEALAAGIAADAGGRDDAVAGDDDRDRIGAVGLADRARDCRRPRGRSRRRSGSRRRGWPQRPPDALAIRRAGGGQRQIERRSARRRNRRAVASRARRSSGVSAWSRPQPQSRETIAPSSSETVMSPIGVCIQVGASRAGPEQPAGCEPHAGRLSRERAPPRTPPEGLCPLGPPLCDPSVWRGSKGSPLAGFQGAEPLGRGVGGKAPDCFYAPPL